MNNKGLTIIELLAVMVIIAIVFIIATIGVSSLRNDTESEIFKRKEEEILIAVEKFHTSNYSSIFLTSCSIDGLSSELPCYYITVEELLNIGDFLDSSDICIDEITGLEEKCIIDPSSGESINDKELFILDAKPEIYYIGYTEDFYDTYGVKLNEGSYKNAIHVFNSMNFSSFIKNYHDENQGLYKHTVYDLNGFQTEDFTYVGTNDQVKQNYVCMHAYNSKDTKPYCEENDTLYRILGVYDNKIKMIEVGYYLSEGIGENNQFMLTGSYSSTDNNFQTSNIYAEFLETFNKIDISDLLLPTYGISGVKAPKENYQEEYQSGAMLKYSLITASEYLFILDEIKTGETPWINADGFECSMTKNNTTLDEIYMIDHSNNTLVSRNINEECNYRLVLTLNEDTTVHEGLGTIYFPFVVSLDYEYNYDLYG